MKNFRSKSPILQSPSAYDQLQPYIVEGLLLKQYEWDGVQEITQLSIRALTDALKTQGAAIRELERNLTSRVNSADFQTALASKVNFSDIIDFKCKKHNESYESFSTEVMKSFNCINQTLANKCERGEIENLYKSISQKPDYSYVHEQINASKTKGAERKENWEDELKNICRVIEGNFNDKLAIVIKSVKRIETDLKEAIKASGIQPSNQELKKSNLNANAEFEAKLAELSSELVRIDKAKPEKQEIKKALHEINQQLHSRLLQLRKEKSPTRRCEACIDPHTFRQPLEPTNENSPIPSKRRFTPSPDLTKLSLSISSKASLSDLNTLSTKLDSKLSEFSKLLLLKPSIKDICTLLDMKANVEDINIALTDIHKELDTKLSRSELPITLNPV